jgi:hypothetical protein
MKLLLWALYFASLSAASGWELHAGSRTWTGSTPQGCTAVFIPRGAQISWYGAQGASTVQFFNVAGGCNRVYRTIMGEGDINASNNIYGFIVKAWSPFGRCWEDWYFFSILVNYIVKTRILCTLMSFSMTLCFLVGLKDRVKDKLEVFTVL